MKEQPGWSEPLHPNLPYFTSEVAWGARREMARTVEDVLARRTRSLLPNARASVAAAPKVAAILAAELGRDQAWQAWQDEQVAAYEAVADGYMLE